MANYNPPNIPGAGVGNETSRTFGTEDLGRGTSGTTGSTIAADDSKGGTVTGAIGTRLERAGDYLDEKGKAAFISERLHNAGRYLQENDVRSISRAVDEAICAHPYRSMLIGLGMGWFVGKFLSR
jgi:hypothetical protein